ncbi:hypothetical protein ABID56_000753 [Alkalibacillus flavidus]|uniref:Uncharacterized protein n=1 Tax=Alkalibacillus flavidus TaxID=546021 RepID=A0ABV2KSW8_9BACI
MNLRHYYVINIYFSKLNPIAKGLSSIAIGYINQ